MNFTLSLLCVCVGQYQKLLKLSDDDLSNFSLLVRPPSLTFIHSSADLCEDFKEDLMFHFSFFGLRNLLVRFATAKRIVGVF